MSPDDKTDLDAKVDAMLSAWPAPSRDDAAWEARANAIVAAATTAPRATDATLSELVAPPRLAAEPGEENTASQGPVRAASGVKAMSEQESNPTSGATKSEPAPAVPATSKRPSLKELAARASQSGSTMRPSAPGSIPPPAASRPLSEAPPPPITAARPSTTPPPRLSEPSREDSGIIDLNKVNAAATPQQVAAAEKAKPAASGLFDEAEGEKGEKGEKKDAAVAAKVTPIEKAREAKAEKAEKTEKKSGGGAVAGIIVALLGVAAAVAIVATRKPAQQPTAQAESKPAVTQEVPAPKQEEPKPAATAAPTGLSFDSLPTETAANDPKPTAPSGGGAAAPSDKAPAANPEPAPTGTGLTVASAPTGKPGDLASEMAKRVGSNGEQPVNADGAEPAAGGKTGNQSIPEQPSQGKVASAVGAVMPGAKACVAGADDVSRASITFGSSGAVSGVNVTGWAAGHGASGCVKNALQGANVGPFAKPSFTFSVTIRP